MKKKLLDNEKSDFLWVLGYFFLNNNKVEKARIIFKALHTLLPEEPRVTSALVYSASLAGHEDAEQYAKLLLDTCPDTFKKEACLLMAKVLWKNGNHEQADRYLKQFLAAKGQ